MACEVRSCLDSRGALPSDCEVARLGSSSPSLPLTPLRLCLASLKWPEAAKRRTEAHHATSSPGCVVSPHSPRVPRRLSSRAHVAYVLYSRRAPSNTSQRPSSAVSLILPSSSCTRSSSSKQLLPFALQSLYRDVQLYSNHELRRFAASIYAQPALAAAVLDFGLSGRGDALVADSVSQSAGSRIGSARMSVVSGPGRHGVGARRGRRGKSSKPPLVGGLPPVRTDLALNHRRA